MFITQNLTKRNTTTYMNINETQMKIQIIKQQLCI